jgi:4-amino-4-deoxy-L-arabinose transferase-like glycosyltransferase
MARAWSWLGISALIWAVLVIVGLVIRPVLPVDETRYLSVAWEMWRDGSFLVPIRNAEAYHHKPPLLFWLIHVTWWFEGVSEVTARLVPPLFALGCLPMLFALARVLDSERAHTAGLAPLLFVGSLLFALFASLTMFDAIVTFWSLVGWTGIGLAWRGRARRGWALFALALGLGILSKGPVMLLHLLPPALLMPWWSCGVSATPARGAWFGGLGVALLAGIAIALTWAIPAALAGGPEFAKAIFGWQHTGRMVESFSHRRPFWFYVPAFVVCVMPVAVWLAPWRAALRTRALAADPLQRFCVATIIPSLVIFSLMSGKQPHYVLPEMALAALALASFAARSEFTDAKSDRILPALVFHAAGLILAAYPLHIFENLARGRVGLELDIPVAVVIFAIAFALIMLGNWTMFGRARPLGTRVTSFAFGGVAIVLGAHIAFVPLAKAYDARPIALEMRKLEEAGRTIVWCGDYEGDFHFAGRLEKKILERDCTALAEWLTARDEGRGVAIAATYRGMRALPGAWPEAKFKGPYRGRVIALWQGEDALARPEILEASR